MQVAIYETMSELYKIRLKKKRNKRQQIKDVTQENGTVSLDQQSTQAPCSKGGPTFLVGTTLMDKKNGRINRLNPRLDNNLN